MLVSALYVSGVDIMQGAPSLSLPVTLFLLLSHQPPCASPLHPFPASLKNSFPGSLSSLSVFIPISFLPGWCLCAQMASEAVRGTMATAHLCCCEPVQPGTWWSRRDKVSGEVLPLREGQDGQDCAKERRRLQESPEQEKGEVMGASEGKTAAGLTS